MHLELYSHRFMFLCAATVLVCGECEASIGWRPVWVGPGQTVCRAHRCWGSISSPHGAAALQQRGNRYVSLSFSGSGRKNVLSITGKIFTEFGLHLACLTADFVKNTVYCIGCSCCGSEPFLTKWNDGFKLRSLAGAKTIQIVFFSRSGYKKVKCSNCWRSFDTASYWDVSELISSPNSHHCVGAGGSMACTAIILKCRLVTEIYFWILTECLEENYSKTYQHIVAFGLTIKKHVVKTI